MNLTRGCIIKLKEFVYEGGKMNPMYVGFRIIVCEVLGDAYFRSNHRFHFKTISVDGYRPQDVKPSFIKNASRVYPNIIEVLALPINYEDAKKEKAIRREERNKLIQKKWIRKA